MSDIHALAEEMKNLKILCQRLLMSDNEILAEILKLSAKIDMVDDKGGIRAVKEEKKTPKVSKESTDAPKPSKAAKTTKSEKPTRDLNKYQFFVTMYKDKSDFIDLFFTPDEIKKIEKENEAKWKGLGKVALHTSKTKVYYNAISSNKALDEKLILLKISYLDDLKKKNTKLNVKDEESDEELEKLKGKRASPRAMSKKPTNAISANKKKDQDEADEVDEDDEADDVDEADEAEDADDTEEVEDL